MSKYSVRRPFTVLVGVVLIIVLGAVSLYRMTADLLPDMSLPYVLVITMYPGGSPEQVEKNVTAPVEAQMATTSNIKTIQSMSYNNYSMVILEYEQDSNMDSIVIEMQQKLDQVSGTFPTGVASPLIMQLDPTMLPIMVASADMEGMSQIEITDYVDSTLVPYLESVEGVASVTTVGSVEERIQITLDEDKIKRINERVIDEINEGFADAEEKMEDGKKKIEDGEKALEDGQKQMMEQIADGSNQIVNGKIQAYVGEATIESNLAMMKMIKPYLERAVKSMNEATKAAEVYENQRKQLEYYQYLLNNATDEEIMAQTGMSREMLAMYVAQASAQMGPAPDTSQAMATLAGLQAAGVDLNALGITADGSNPEQLAKDLSQALATVNSSIATMEAAKGPLAEGKVTLDDAYKKLNQGLVKGILEIAKAQGEIASGKLALEQGEAQLESAKEEALKAADLSNLVTAEMLGNLIVAQDFSMPAGYITEGVDSYLITVGDSVTTIEDLENMVLLDMGMEDIEPILVKDVANVDVVNNAADSYSKINGNPAVMLSIEKQTGYSTGDVTDRLLDRFEELEKENDKLNFAVLMNQGVYIDIVISSVLQNMLIGAALAIIILILFLKDFKSTFIIACSIPLSVVFAIVLMYFTHITLNIISLSGLALGIGMLVDNSIVVIENIYRLRKEGLSVKKAAVEGARGVGGAIFASTLTTVCVFAPIVFAKGLTKQIFVDMALTVTYTLAASLIVALTFVPAVASMMIKDGEEKQTRLFDRFRDFYGVILEKVLRAKPAVILLAVILLVASVFAGFSKGFSFLSMDIEVDQISMTVSPKEGDEITDQELMALCDQVTEKVMAIDGIETVGVMTGGGSALAAFGMGGDQSATYYLLLDEKTHRKMKDIQKDIVEQTKDIDCEVKVETSSGDMLSLLGSGLTVMVKGRDLDQIREYTEEVVRIMEETPGVIDIKDGMDDTTPCLKIHVDKVKAMEYKLTTAQVYMEVMKAIMPSTPNTTLIAETKDYDIYVIAEEQKDTTLRDIYNLKFPYTTQDGKHLQIPISRIVTFEKTDTLNVINRDAQTKYISVTAGVDEDHNITYVSQDLQERFKSIPLKEGYSIKMSGEDEMILDAMKQLVLMLILAVVFIYLVMVAQFQSLLSPFIIMFTIPLAFTGGFFGLYFTRNTVSVIGMVGFVMLAGIIVNNGIVMVDYINQLRREGKTKKEAIVESATARLRPILMTTLTTVISMSTLALGVGGGSAMMQPMAIVMIGGLVYGTILTLFVVPVLYDLMNREKNMVEEVL
ncbi:MAG: efflux RND transporter permease subunit [Lachnospiraceae bacterium]|nr:efflux RND transporter permease subunit [Lachnospiraceae bacterium]